MTNHLDDFDQRYSAAQRMVGLTFISPGYHTRVATGTWVHHVVPALEYAVLCLREESPERHARAAAILEQVLTLQDTDPTSATYGFWPYVLEEPLAAMALPDGNMAEFDGARVAEVLSEHPARLPAALVPRLRAALGHAAWTTFRRNIGPSYTNIAIMGGGLTAVAGELLGEPRLLDYGRRRLRRVVELAHRNTTLSEYNSPPYTMIALQECERILALAHDPQVLADAAALWRVAWEVIAEHWHPATQQWAGPQSRTYSDWVTPSLAEALSVRTGGTIQPVAAEPAANLACNVEVQPRPCPADLRARFTATTSAPREWCQTFIRRADEATSVTGTTWCAPDACLGSVSRDNFFYQRRPVLGYWRGPAGAPAVLRLRCLCNGRDFSSGYVRNAQRGPRVLSALSLVAGLGYYALHMDIPAGGVFEVDDLRVRYHLIAPDAAVHGNELAAAAWRAVIHPAPSRFGPFTVRWETGQQAGAAWVDGVCYAGPRRSFRWEELGDVALAVGLELLQHGEPVATANPEFVNRIGVSWEGLTVRTALRPEPYLWA